MYRTRRDPQLNKPPTPCPPPELQSELRSVAPIADDFNKLAVDVHAIIRVMAQIGQNSPKAVHRCLIIGARHCTPPSMAELDTAPRVPSAKRTSVSTPL